MRILAALWLLIGTAIAQAGGAVAPHPSPYKLLRSVSGGKSERTSGGAFHISDPRSTFYLPEDTKVIVYMEWEGPSGKHTFEAYWRNPAGKTTVISDFAYETKPSEKRYGGYMELILNPEMQTGMWQMEGRIDGEVLGTHTFEIVSAVKPAIKEDTRTTLALGELYSKANNATANIESLDADGKVFRTGLGFAIADNALVTAFQIIDGATTVRIRMRGQDQTVKELLAADRWQDWAVLPITGGAALTRAPSAANVGDRGFTLNVDQTGNRTIVDATLIGRTQGGKGGERLKMTSTLVPQAIGAPVVNDYGEVTALAGGIVLPGARSLYSRESGNLIFAGYPTNVLNTNIIVAGSDTAVPIEKVAKGWSKPTSFQELMTSGVFTPFFAARIRVGRGTLCKDMTKNGDVAFPAQDKFDFTRAETATVYIQWSPVKKDKATATVQIYDIDNKPLPTAVKPAKVSVSPNEYLVTTWKVPLAELQPGIYRVDVLLDGETTWRSYLRVTQ
jgi:hypothetical protein